MKTPDEIKKGLCNCVRDTVCKDCPYDYDCSMTGDSRVIARDSLEYIQQLEKQITELTAKVAQFEAAQPKWNEIKDRPPEDEFKKYLVAFQSSGKYVIDTAFYNAEYGFTLSHLIPGDITHWMYAPEPPKE